MSEALAKAAAEAARERWKGYEREHLSSGVAMTMRKEDFIVVFILGYLQGGEEVMVGVQEYAKNHEGKLP